MLSLPGDILEIGPREMGFIGEAIGAIAETEIQVNMSIGGDFPVRVREDNLVEPHEEQQGMMVFHTGGLSLMFHHFAFILNVNAVGGARTPFKCIQCARDHGNRPVSQLRILPTNYIGGLLFAGYVTKLKVGHCRALNIPYGDEEKRTALSMEAGVKSAISRAIGGVPTS